MLTKAKTTLIHMKAQVRHATFKVKSAGKRHPLLIRNPLFNLISQSLGCSGTRYGSGRRFLRGREGPLTWRAGPARPRTPSSDPGFRHIRWTPAILTRSKRFSSVSARRPQKRSAPAPPSALLLLASGRPQLCSLLQVGLYDWSFEDIAGGILAGRRYSIVVCSFSLHLCDPSYLTTCCRSLAQSCANLVIITPHKRPEITEAMGWRLVSDIRDAEWRVRLRRYVSTEHTSLDPSSGDGVVKLETVWSFGAAEAASESRASASHEEIGITVDGASDEADAAADRQRRLDLLDRFCDDGSASAATGESGADGSVGTVGCGSEVDDGNGIDNSNDDEGDWETDDDGADVSAPAPVSSAAVSKANPSQRTVWGDLNLSGSQASVDLVAAKASLDKLIARRKIRDAAAEMQVAQGQCGLLSSFPPRAISRNLLTFPRCALFYVAEVARLEAEAARALSAEKRREDEEAKRKANATKEREKRARAKAAEAKAAKAAKAAEKARTEKEARKQRELEERARIKQREKEAAAAEALRMAKRREIADRLKNAAGDFGRPSDAVTVVLDSGTAPLDMAARAAAMKAAIAARLGGSGPKSSMDLSARVAAKRAEIVERLASTPDGAASSR